MLFSLAWRNIWRQKTRTIITLSSLGFTSALLVLVLSVQLGMYETMKNNSLALFDGFAQIERNGYSDDPELDKSISDPDSLIQILGEIPGVTAATPRATSFAILANDEVSFGAAIVGVDPTTEPMVSTLSTTVVSGRFLTDPDAGEIILGDTLARNLGLSLGQSVTVLGTSADRSIAADSLILVGIFKTGMVELDRSIAQMPLRRFQETFGMGETANVVALSGKRIGDVNAALPAIKTAVEKIDAGLVVRDWKEIQPAVYQVILLDASTSLTTYFTLVVIVVFIIFNTLLMSVLERTREFGVLLAVGMKPSQLGKMMWVELVMLAVLGCTIGIAIGGAGAFWLELVGFTIPGMEEIMAQFGLSDRLYPDLSIISAIAGPTLIVTFVAIGGIIPYRRILRLEPVSAMGEG